MTRPEPLRFQMARAYLASVRDMGDPTMIESAVRLWWSVQSPRTRPCLPADRENFREWEAAQ